MYVEFTLSQKQEHFLGCHARAFEYFGGVPESVMETDGVSPRFLDFHVNCGRA